MPGRRTTVLVAGAVERTPTRTRAVLLVAIEVEHDERQLAFGFDRRDRSDVVEAPERARSAA